MKLHLGCGKRFIPGFVHIDLAKFDHIDHQANIDDLSFIKNESVDLIYACQVLEYFDRDEMINVLDEWKRVLKKGATLRVSVPNFEIITDLYNKGLELDKFLGTLYGKWPISENKYVFHKTTFDFDSINKLFSNLEFTNVRHWDWRKTEHAHIDDYSQAYYPHMDKENGILFNLNVEADKKG